MLLCSCMHTSPRLIANPDSVHEIRGRENQPSKQHFMSFYKEKQNFLEAGGGGGGGGGAHPAGLYADNPLAGDDSPEALLITVHL